MAEDIGALEFRVIANLTQIDQAERRLAALRELAEKNIEFNISASYASVAEAMRQIASMQKQIDDLDWQLRVRMDPDDVAVAQAVVAGMKAKMSTPVEVPVNFVAGSSPSRVAAGSPEVYGPPAPSSMQPAAASTAMASREGAAPEVVAAGSGGGGRRGGFLGKSIFRHYWTYNFGAMVAGRALQGVAEGIAMYHAMGAAQSLARVNALGGATQYDASVKSFTQEVQSLPIAGPIGVGVAKLISEMSGSGGVTQELKSSQMRTQLMGSVARFRASSAAAAANATLRIDQASGNYADLWRGEASALRAEFDQQEDALRAQVSKEQSLAQTQGDLGMIADQQKTQMQALTAAYKAQVLTARNVVARQEAQYNALGADAAIDWRAAATGAIGRGGYLAARDRVATLMGLFHTTGLKEYKYQAIEAEASISEKLRAYYTQTAAMRVEGMATTTTREKLAALKARETLALQDVFRTAPTQALLRQREAVVHDAYRHKMRAVEAEAHKRHVAATAKEAEVSKARESHAREVLSELRAKLVEARSRHPHEAALKLQERDAMARLRADKNLTPTQLAEAAGAQKQIYAAEMGKLHAKDRGGFARVMDPGAIEGISVMAQHRKASSQEKAATELAKIAASVEKLVEAGAGHVLQLFNLGGA